MSFGGLSIFQIDSRFRATFLLFFHELVRFRFHARLSASSSAVSCSTAYLRRSSVILICQKYVLVALLAIPILDGQRSNLWILELISKSFFRRIVEFSECSDLTPPRCTPPRCP